MRWLLIQLLDWRVQRLTRDLLKHGERHCVGANEHCDTWAAISEQYDDALNRLREVREATT